MQYERQLQTRKSRKYSFFRQWDSYKQHSLKNENLSEYFIAATF